MRKDLIIPADLSIVQPNIHSGNPGQPVSLQLARLPQILLGCVAFFTLANLAIVYLRFTRFSHTEVEQILTRFLGTDAEGNIPTYYASITLLLSGLLAGAIGLCSSRTDRRGMRYWLGLAAVFALMSIDEMCGLHDFINDNLPAMLKSLGIPLPSWMLWPWVILGALFALAMFWLYLPFVLSLPRRTRNLIILSGAVFVAGAVGCETFGGAVKSVHGPGLGTALLASLEEFLEMLGVAILVQALIEHLSRCFPVVTVTLATAEQAATSSVPRQRTQARGNAEERTAA